MPRLRLARHISTNVSPCDDTVANRPGQVGSPAEAFRLLKATADFTGLSAASAYSRLTPTQMAAIASGLSFSGKDRVADIPPNPNLLAFDHFARRHMLQTAARFGTLQTGINVDAPHPDISPMYTEASAINEFIGKTHTSVFTDSLALVKHITGKADGEYFIASHPETALLVLIDAAHAKSAPVFAALHIIVTGGEMTILGRDSNFEQTNWHPLDPATWPLADESLKLTALDAGTQIMASPYYSQHDVPEGVSAQATALQYACQYFSSRGQSSLLTQLFFAARARSGDISSHQTSAGDSETIINFIHRLLAQYGLRSFGLQIGEATKITAVAVNSPRHLPAGYNVYIFFPTDKPATIMMRENGSARWINLTQLTTNSTILHLFSNDGLARYLGTCIDDHLLSEKKLDQLHTICRDLVNFILQNSARHTLLEKQQKFAANLYTHAVNWPTDRLIAEIGNYAEKNGVEYDASAYAKFAAPLIMAKQQIFEDIVRAFDAKITGLSESATDLFRRAIQDYTMHYIYLWLAENTIVNRRFPIAVQLEHMAMALTNLRLPIFDRHPSFNSLLDFCTEATANGRAFSNADVHQAVDLLKDLPFITKFGDVVN